MTLKQSATFRKWHAKLNDDRARAIITIRLERLARGHFGDVSPVGEGLSELQIHYGPGYRIYLQQRCNLIVLLLCGGTKSSQDRDIKAAKRIAAAWSDLDG